MGGQLTKLQKNISTLSPEVQQDVYNAMKKAYYGAIINKSKTNPEYQQAREYLDHFFNTPEGRRFHGGSFDPVTGETQAATVPTPTAYEQRFGTYGGARTNVTDVTPEQPTGTYISPAGEGMSISEAELQKGIAAGTVQAGGTYRATTGEYYTITSQQTQQTPKQQTQQTPKEQFLQIAKEQTEIQEAREEAKYQELSQAKATAERYRSFDLFSSDFLARAEGGGISGFGTVAKSILTTGDIISAQLRLDEINIPVLKEMTYSKTQATRIGSDILTFAYFSPAFPSTVSIEKAVQPTGVIFGGTKQVVKGDLIKTDLRFITSKGEKGVATGLTKVQQGEIIISKTDTMGLTFKRGVEVPTGKEIIEIDKTFAARAIGLGKPLESGVLKEFSVGKIFIREGRKQTADIFIGRGYSLEGKTGKVLFAGQTISKKTMGSYETGLIETLPETETIKIVSKTFMPSKISQVSLSTVQSTVKTALSIPSLPKTPTSILTATTITPTVMKGKTQPVISKKIQISKTESIMTLTPKVSERIKVSPFVRQEVGLSLALGQGVITRQLSLTQQLPKQKQRAEVSLKTKQLQKTRTLLSSKMRLIQRQEQQAVRVSMFFPFVPRVPTPRRTPFPFISLKGKPQSISTGKFTVSERRFGKFRTIGTGLTLKQAISVGREKTGRTLGASFKISGGTGRGLNIPTPKGYRKKYEKKEGIVLIEQPKYRLNLPSEISEIQRAKKRKLKGGRKKKK